MTDITTEAGTQLHNWAPAHNDRCSWRYSRGEKPCDCGLAKAIADIEAESEAAEHERALDACAAVVMTERDRIERGVRRLDAFREPLRRDWEVSLAGVIAVVRKTDG